MADPPSIAQAVMKTATNYDVVAVALMGGYIVNSANQQIEITRPTRTLREDRRAKDDRLMFAVYQYQDGSYLTYHFHPLRGAEMRCHPAHEAKDAPSRSKARGKDPDHRRVERVRDPREDRRPPDAGGAPGSGSPDGSAVHP